MVWRSKLFVRTTFLIQIGTRRKRIRTISRLRSNPQPTMIKISEVTLNATQTARPEAPELQGGSTRLAVQTSNRRATRRHGVTYFRTGEIPGRVLRRSEADRTDGSRGGY